MGLVFIAHSVAPNRGYEKIEATGIWNDWRNDYQKQLSDEKDLSFSEIEQFTSEETLEQLTEKLSEAQLNNESINEKRYELLTKSHLWLMLALTGLLLKSILHVWLIFQGVINVS